MKRVVCRSLGLACFAMAVVAPSLQALETIYIVRHADKAAYWPKSRTVNAFHPLSRAGMERAEKLVEVLKDSGVVAIYASATTRSLATGMPLAEATKVPISPDPRTIRESEMGAFFAGLKRDHADHEAVLIVGHSNTVPHLLIELGAEPSCWQRLDIADHDGELLIHGYEGLWVVDASATGCGALERRTVKIDGDEAGDGDGETGD